MDVEGRADSTAHGWKVMGVRKRVKSASPGF